MINSMKNRFLELIKNKNNCKRQRKGEEFIIKFNEKYRSNTFNTSGSLSISALDTRRIVFVSLVNLYKTWMKYESHILYSAILVMPIQKKWIYNSSHYSKIYAEFDVESGDILEFIQFLQFKDCQGLIFYMLDEYKYPKNAENRIVAPFWYHLSNKLITLYDPVTRQKYKPLQLDPKWWQNTDFECKYHVKISNVLTELYFITMHFKTIQEILYQSNPTSLNPIKCYRESTNINNFVKYIFTKKEEEWYISEDYNLE